MVVTAFNIGKLPIIKFGAGVFDFAVNSITAIGNDILIVTGGTSFSKTVSYNNFVSQLNKYDVRCYTAQVESEPTPEMIDNAVKKFSDKNIDVVVSIGGGSVIDAGKAISAMLYEDGSVEDYLEDVGTKIHSGRKVPFFAIPTTSGTGSEATKNAVLSRVGKDGFKKSLRHDNFTPDYAIIDPLLTVNMPKKLTICCGMDTLSQLLESYISTKANPVTDALALSGLKHFAQSFETAVETGDYINARADMCYASLMSGITLANAGLAAIHGIAGYLGGLYNIPHGAACGTLIAETLKYSVIKMRKNSKNYTVPLSKIAEAGKLFSDEQTGDENYYIDLLLDKLSKWTDLYNIPRLAEFGIANNDIKTIASKCEIKNHPYSLSSDEIEEILFARL